MPVCIQASWSDVPHISPEVQEQLLASMQPHTREARTKGVPALGAGAIYPVPESVFVIDPFELPEYWPRAYGLDVGWNRTAALWGAWDREDDTVYCYAEHYMGQAAPSIHASAIKRRGQWIWGAIDPASAGANQVDGRKLREEYEKEQLNLVDADNTVEAGIHACYQRLVTGRLKIFSSCINTITEIRIYRRDEKGKVVKENDHLMDAMRYLIMTGMQMARTDPGFEDDEYDNTVRNDTTGY